MEITAQIRHIAERIRAEREKLSICNALQINPAVLFEVQDAERKEARETVINLVSRFM